MTRSFRAAISALAGARIAWVRSFRHGAEGPRAPAACKAIHLGLALGSLLLPASALPDDWTKAHEERVKAEAKYVEERAKARAKALEEEEKARAKWVEERAKGQPKWIEEQEKARAKAIEERGKADAKRIEERGKARARAIEDDNR